MMNNGNCFLLLVICDKEAKETGSDLLIAPKFRI